MSTEEHIAQLTAQIATLQAQLTRHSQSPPPPPKPPKVSAPSPFSGAQDNLDCFKAECSLYLSMRQSKFLDECHGMTSLLPFLVFVCPLPHLCHLLTPSDLIHLPSTASTPTLRCTCATMLHPCSD